MIFLVTSESGKSYNDQTILLSAKKCFYGNCEKPGEGEDLTVSDRPEHATYWSQPETWTSGIPPADNENVVIRPGKFINNSEYYDELR